MSEQALELIIKELLAGHQCRSQPEAPPAVQAALVFIEEGIHVSISKCCVSRGAHSTQEPPWPCRVLQVHARPNGSPDGQCESTKLVVALLPIKARPNILAQVGHHGEHLLRVGRASGPRIQQGPYMSMESLQDASGRDKLLQCVSATVQVLHASRQMVSRLCCE